MTSQLQARPEPADPAPSPARVTSPARERIAALSVLAVLLLVGAAAAASLRPPSPRPASAPATDFSAARATALLGGIASVPHPSGSPAAAEVRSYLVGQLRALGLQPEVQTRVATRSTTPGRSTAGTVSNVHATIAGSQPTGRVLLVAHYDSVPTGPGAADDGANVATILELARVLRAGPQPRNDIDLLFTDGEEQGLLGAQAFVDSGVAGDPRRVVAVNLEARGVSGPAMMFQMSGTGLVPAVRAGDPVTTSFAAAVYRVLPNDTDLSVFDAGGMRGLNFAFIDDSAHYHTPHDDLAHVSGASVQDMGDSALAAVRYLAGSDLAADGPDATYFSLFGTVVSYPAWLVLPLAALALAGFVLLLVAGRRRGLRLRGAARSAGIFALVLPAAAVVGVGGWWLVTLLRPDFVVGLGSVYRPGRYLVAEAMVLLVALIAGYRWARRKASPAEVATGVLGWFALLAVVSAVLLPGGAYLFTWPLLFGVAALLAALRFTGPGSPVRTLAGCAAALPAMALVLPVALLLLPALGPGLTPVALFFGALIAAALAAVLEPLPRRRVLTAGLIILTVAAAATVGIGAATDDYDPSHPQPVSLAYTLEADTGTATWISAGGPDQPQVGPLLTGGTGDLAERVPSLAGWDLSTGPAAAATGVTGPQLDGPAATESAGLRSIHVRLRAPADAYRVDVYADTSHHEIVSATADGATLAGGLTAPGDAGDWRWSFRYTAPPAAGVDLVLQARGDGPLRLRVVSTAVGLPAGVGAPTLGPDVSWPGWPVFSGETLVVRTFTF